jgi:hypothetical protein
VRCSSVIALLTTIAPLVACGSRPYVDPDAGAGGSLSGRIVFGRVAGSTVDVYRLTATRSSGGSSGGSGHGSTVDVYRLTATGERGARIASKVADEEGGFSVTLGASEGPFLVAARGGSYVDVATGAAVPLDASELTAMVPSFTAGAQMKDVLVTPVSHLVTALALRWTSPGLPLPDAVATAQAHLHNHFGAVDWNGVLPEDLTVAGNPAPAAASTVAAVMIAGLCEQARLISERAARPGTVTGLRLLQALSVDLAWDGFFDGQAQQQLVLPEGVPVAQQPPSGTALDGDALRFTLARSIQSFLNGPRNATPLRPEQVLSLLDALSRASDPLLFRTGGAGGFDSTPPHVVFTVKYALAGGPADADPVGPARLVAGELTVTADATDPSGLESLALFVDGAPLRPAPQGNTPSHFVGFWTAGASGPLTLTARAVDRRGNAGEVSYPVRVDADGPGISVTSPVEDSFHSGSVAVRATASDGEGLASFATTGPTAIVDNDGALEGIAGTLNVATVADGPLALNFSACDLVGHCTLVVRHVTVDNTPPSVSPAAPPPAYTNNSVLTLALQVQDGGSGVREVWVRQGGSRVQASLDTATGRYVVQLALVAGQNQLAAYAIDQAGNSGDGKPFPGTFAFTVMLDRAPPLIENTAAAGVGYRSEAMLALLSDSVPPQLTNSASSERPRFGETVAKASTLLDWQGVAPSAQELESGNASNTPYLTFRAPFDSEMESPIHTATFTVTCTGCATAPVTASGPLLPSPSPTPGYVQWQLALNSVTVPFLGRLTTPSTILNINVQMMDRAGNTGSLNGSLTFAVVAPPLWWRSGGDVFSEDSQGVYSYRRLNGKYAQLFDPANSAFAPSGGQARVLRYIVRNPFPHPAAVSFTTPGSAASWSFVETEANVRSGPGTQGAATRTYIVGSACQEVSPPPCDSVTQWIVRAFYGSFTGEFCQPIGEANLPAPTNPVIGSTTGWDVRGFLDDFSTGNEQIVAPSYSINGTTFVRVPAAAGPVAGQVVIYVVIPRNRNNRPAITWNPTASRFEYQYGQFYGRANQYNVSCGDFGFTTYQDWTRAGWARYLTGLSFAGSGSFSVVTQGVVDDGQSFTPLGAPRVYANGTYSVSRSLD